MLVYNINNLSFHHILQSDTNPLDVKTTSAPTDKYNSDINPLASVESRFTAPPLLCVAVIL